MAQHVIFVVGKGGGGGAAKAARGRHFIRPPPPPPPPPPKAMLDPGLDVGYINFSATGQASIGQLLKEAMVRDKVTTASRMQMQTLQIKNLEAKPL